MRPDQKRLLKFGCLATLGLFVVLLAMVLAVSPQLRERVERRLWPEPIRFNVFGMLALPAYPLYPTPIRFNNLAPTQPSNPATNHDCPLTAIT